MDSSNIQVLHAKLQAIYNRSLLANGLKNYLPEAADFSKELFNNPFFEGPLQEIQKQLQANLTYVLELKKSGNEEINATRRLLANHVPSIPTLSNYLEEFNDLDQQRLAMSWELLFDLEAVIIRACLFLKLNQQMIFTKYPCHELLTQLAKLDDKGNIVEYIFAPSIRLAWKELELRERTEKTALWRSVHILSQVYALYDLKNYKQRYNSLIANKQFSAAYFFKNDFQLFDEALTKNNPSKQVKEQFSVEEYRMHMNRVWAAIEPKLIILNDKIKDTDNEPLFYKYSVANDLRKGELSRNKASCELVGNSAEVLYLALKEKNLSNDEAGENLPDSLHKKDQVNSALRVIRNNALKTFGIKKYISSKNSIISVNYPTRLIK